MTVENENTPRKQYAGNGVTTTFPITFAFRDDSEIVVELEAADGSFSIPSYSVVDDDVECTTAPASGETLHIYADTAATQSTDLVPNNALPSAILEAMSDKLTRLAQQVLANAILLPGTTDDDFDNILPEGGAGDYLKKADDGLGWEWSSAVLTDTVTPTAFVLTLLDDETVGAFLTTLGISSFIQTLLDDPDAATARATLGIAAGASEFPSGTIMFFGQATSPVDWTKITSGVDGSMLVLNSDPDGTALDSGGAADPRVGHTHTGPSHNHSQTSHYHAVSITTGTPSITVSNVTQTGSKVVADDEHTHPVSGNTGNGGGGNTGNGGTGATGANAIPYFYEVIACVKD